LAGSSAPGTGFFRNGYENRKVAAKERGTHGPNRFGRAIHFARLAISFQLFNYFHAIKVANAGKRFKGLLV
jgi:hypothetical protein